MTVHHRFEHEDDEDMAVLGPEPLQYGHLEPDPIRARVLERESDPEFVDHLQGNYWVVQAANDPDQALGCDVTKEVKR